MWPMCKFSGHLNHKVTSEISRTYKNDMELEKDLAQNI